MPTEATVNSHYGPHPMNTFETLIGRGTIFQDLLEQIRLVAQADCRVLLVGAQGTGKETLARTIHSYSTRHRLPFHKINCADFRPNTTQHPLQLWNQEDDTHTINPGDVPIDLTHGGTLYLHEVGSLSPEAQTWLLRCLLTIEMESLNSANSDKEDEIRVIAGTTRNLQDDVMAHRFRPELFYRLNVVPLHIPLLRHRLEDIEALAYHFVRIYSGKYGKRIERVSEETFQVLRNYDWPGNIEEMESLFERSIIRSKGPTLDIEQIVQGPANFPLHS
ncbi:MAG: sigma-54-dependent transcriptional regulator [Nitrospirales bacterium]